MRKDFLVDPYQLLEARAAGAGGALLIVRLVEDAVLVEMLEAAAGLGRFVVLESFAAAGELVAAGRDEALRSCASA